MKIFGIRIRFNVTGVFLFLILGLLGPAGMDLLKWRTWTTFLPSLLFVTLAFFSLLGHELSHCLVIRRCGIKVHAITVWAYGMTAIFAGGPDFTPDKEFFVSIVGPIVSLAFAGIFWLLSTKVPFSLFANSFGRLFVLNNLLAIFNLLPVFPLDGGRVFHSVLWKFFGLRRAINIVTATTSVLAISLLVLNGYWMLCLAKTDLLWLSSIFIILAIAAHRERRGMLSSAGNRNGDN